VPIGLLAIGLTALFVPESRAERPRRIDPVGQLLVIVALASLTYAIIGGPADGWTGPQTICLFVISALAFGALVPYERRRSEPLIEMRFFRSAPFSGATATAVALFAAMGGFLFLNTLYLQDVRGVSPLTAGLYMLPMAGVMLIVAPIAGRLVSTRGARLPLIGGALALIASGLMLTRLAPHTAMGYLIAAYALFGLGAGALNPPITNTAVSGMPAAQAGVAAAVASTGRQVGQTLGVAVLGALAGSGASAAIGPSFTQATHASWWIVVGIGFLLLAIALVTTTPWADRTARVAAEAIGEEDRRARAALA
jgi:predicted MFS family arabinose efflux permease